MTTPEFLMYKKWMLFDSAVDGTDGDIISDIILPRSFVVTQAVAYSQAGVVFGAAGPVPLIIGMYPDQTQPPVSVDFLTVFDAVNVINLATPDRAIWTDFITTPQEINGSLDNGFLGLEIQAGVGVSVTGKILFYIEGFAAII